MGMLQSGEGRFGVEYYDKLAKGMMRDWFVNRADRDQKYKEILSASTLFSNVKRVVR